MYKEILNVIVEMIRNSFHKVTTVKQFLLHIVLTDFDNIARNMHFIEHTLMELVKMFLQVDNFPYFVPYVLDIVLIFFVFTLLNNTDY